MKRSDIMIDIETMSIAHNAAILTIAAIHFDPRSGVETKDEILKNKHRTFLRRISLRSNEEYGRKIDAGTVEWWLQQDSKAQMELIAGDITNAHRAAKDFIVWTNSLCPTIHTIWANDPDFDCVILSSLFRDVGVIWPFKYWQNRSVRTIKDLASPDEPFPITKTSHVALDDCAKQAIDVQYAWQQLHPGA